MNPLNYTALSEAKVAPVVDALAPLLADLQIYYTNLRGFHWNVVGPQFFPFHEQFEHLYNSVNEKVDEVAERILQLGATPEHRYSEYVKRANVKDTAVVRSGEEGMHNVLDTLKLLIAQERKVLAAAQEAGDEVTAAIMSDYLRGQEKQVWMLTATFTKA